MEFKIVLGKNNYRYIELLLVIMVSVCPYISTIGKIAIMFFLLAVNIKRVASISKNFYLILVAMAIPSLLDIFNTTSGTSYSGNNLYYPFCMFVGAIIATNYNVNDFLIRIEKIIYVLAFLSLIGMSVYYIAPGMIESFPTYQFYNLTHRTIYFFNYIYAQGFLMVRNSGIAWEPGVFQILLNLGLAITIKKYDELNYKKVFVYTLAIILTRSTTGLLILMINLILLVRKKKIFVILLGIVVLIFSTELYSILTEQISTKWIGTMAFSTRYEKSINAILYSWKYVFGIGSTGYNNVYLTHNLGSFDSYSQILMRYGYLLLIILFYILLKIGKQDWYIAAILALSMMSESMWGSVLFSVFYFIYLENKGAEAIIIHRSLGNNKRRPLWRKRLSL